MCEKTQIIKNTKFGVNPKIWNFVNIYDSEIGDNVTIASFVEIGGAKIGNNCSFQCGVFVSPGSIIGNNCFFGPKSVLANDRKPKANNKNFKQEPVVIKDNVSIDANATILPGVIINEGAMVGAGTTVTKNVEKYTIIVNKQEIRVL